jgi:hypothetical protein
MAVEPGELYALSSNLAEPVVEDICDEDPVLANDAPAELALGPNTVTWTVTDADGNIATAEQAVLVVNERPVADAGDDVIKTGQTDRTRVRLDGRGSYDPDDHSLTFQWRAPGVRFENPAARRPIGMFPSGPTHVTLTVTDEAGARSKDTVRVVLKPQRREPRTAASARAVTATAYEGARRLASSENDSPRAAEALRATEAAFFAGRFADAEYGAVDLFPEASEDLANYRELRAGQVGLSLAAYRSLYQAYLEGADETALFAGAEAYRGAVDACAALVD